MGVSKNRGTLKWMVKIMENPFGEWMIWGENPLFLETPDTLQGTNISPQKWDFEDDFPFPKVGYVNPLEGMLIIVMTPCICQVVDCWSSRPLLSMRFRYPVRHPWRLSSHQDKVDLVSKQEANLTTQFFLYIFWALTWKSPEKAPFIWDIPFSEHDVQALGGGWGCKLPDTFYLFDLFLLGVVDW